MIPKQKKKLKATITKINVMMLFFYTILPKVLYMYTFEGATRIYFKYVILGR